MYTSGWGRGAFHRTAPVTCVMGVGVCSTKSVGQTRHIPSVCQQAVRDTAVDSQCVTKPIAWLHRSDWSFISGQRWLAQHQSAVRCTRLQQPHQHPSSAMMMTSWSPRRSTVARPRRTVARHAVSHGTPVSSRPTLAWTRAVTSLPTMTSFPVVRRCAVCCRSWRLGCGLVESQDEKVWR